MRAGPLAAALVIVLFLPTAGADGGGVALGGPAKLPTDGATVSSLRVSLRLEGIVCTGPTEVPVRLSVARTLDARAKLSSERLTFPLAPAAAARSWRASSETELFVEPSGASGLVEILARYELPAKCASASGVRSGEARHVVALGSDGSGESRHDALLRGLRALDGEAAAGERLPLSVQVAIVATCAAGFVVFGKRIRALPP